MTRNLKALGLAFIAICAMSVLAAQAASAAEFHSEKQNTIITGTSESAANGGDQVFEPVPGSGVSVTCHHASFAGTNTAEGGSGSNWTSQSITVHPLYGNSTTETTSACDSSLGANTATVSTAGCHYKLFAATTAGNPTGGEHANVELLGCTGGGIVITVTGVGNILVKNQLIEHAVRYKSTGSTNKREVTVEATAHNIEWECTTGKAKCVTAFGASSGTEATYKGNVTTAGFVDPEPQSTSEVNSLSEGAQVGIWKE